MYCSATSSQSYAWLLSNLQNTRYSVLGASVSEPHTSELNSDFLWYVHSLWYSWHASHKNIRTYL